MNYSGNDFERDYQKLIDLANSSEEADRAIGSVFGAFIGDAAGAVLEFFDSRIDEFNVIDALKMPGGGRLGMGKGQITDDSEMALCIMHGLVDEECSRAPEKIPQVLNLDGITHYFGIWSRKAFDIGFTTRKAFNKIYDFYNKNHHDTLAVFREVKK